MRSLVAALNEIYPNNNFCFIQDSAPSHCVNIIQNVLREQLKSRFASNTEWTPSSPDCNLLDYYFWNKVEEKVVRMDFESENELKDKELCTTKVLQMLDHFAKQGNVFTTFKRCSYKRRKTDQGLVLLNFVLLLSKFISKGEFSTAM